MQNELNAVKVADNTYWVGIVDDRKVPFHRLILEKGTTYNSYLMMTEKPTLIDTVDISFGREFVEKMSGLMDLDDLAYVVVNHVEPDHAGALPALLSKARNAVIVTTALGAELLKDMFRIRNREFLIVNDGDSLDIGGKTLQFLETPYLHTAETMVTYAVEDKVLYPCDQFSTHIAAHELFNDLAEEDYLNDFETYYKLIMGPHRPYVRKMLEKVADLEINMIAPSHGYILREDPQRFISLYDEMSALSTSGETKRVTIVYSTMTGNTRKLAQQLAEAIADQGMVVSEYNLKNADIKEVADSIRSSDGLLVGSSTRYADMVGDIEKLLQELTKTEVKNIPAAAFGSYGWSGEATLHIENYLEEAGFQVINERHLLGNHGYDMSLFPLRVKFIDEEGLERALQAGELFSA